MDKQTIVPLVSVIVPIYNAEKYIHRCMQSLIAQTLKEIEFILVDDGSPDGCGAIVDDYAQKHSNIVAIHKKNGGLSDARNAGLAVAKGKYVGFLDPDDYVEPDMYETMLASARSNDSDLVICGYKEVFSSTLVHERTFGFLSDLKHSSDILKALVEGHVGAYAWNKLYKNSVIKSGAIQFPKGVVVVEDQVFFCEFIKHVQSFSVVEECLYNYIRNNESICAKYHNRQFEFYKIGAAAREDAILHFGDEIEQATFVRNKVNLLQTLLNVLDMQASVRNKISVLARYKEMCILIADSDLLNLIRDYGQELTERSACKKIKLIRSGKKRSLFLYEFYKMRIVERIKYYLG